MATIEDISEPGTSHEYRSDKMLLLTWHNSTPDKDFVCDSLHLSLCLNMILVGKYSVCESITPRKLSFEKTELDGEVGFVDVVEVGRTEVPVSREASRTEEHVVEHDIVEEVVDGSYEEDVEHGNDQEAIEAPSDEQVNYDVEGIDIAYETQYHVESSEDACTDDDDDLLVYEEMK
nr:hypothetical protein [Tanacetum cinerariifolium]